ncbi:MAG: TRAP transporter large permease [Promethearchaeota archaeon]
MDQVTVGIIGLIVFFALLIFGLPIGLGMALVGFVGLWYFAGEPAAMIKMALTPFSYASMAELSVLPLFLLMANVLATSGITRDLYNLAAKWLGRLPGGLAMGTIAGCAVFAGASASSIATAATMGAVAVPEMKRYNYDPGLATGCIAAGGSLGILIPPSAMFILYGILTGTSIGRLFMAGVIPGILEAIFYIVTIYILCRRNPTYGPRGPAYSLKEKVMAIGSCGEIVGLIILVMAGIYLGWFTPSEAGAVGAIGAITFSLLRRRLNLKGFLEASLTTLKSTGLIFFILIGAMIFGHFIVLSRIPYELAGFIAALPLPPLAIMGIIMVIYIFLGAIMDVSAMLVITTPIFFPVAMVLGFNPIWFGVIVTRMMEIGMITPPIGINVFVISGMSGEPLQTVFRGIVPFLISDIIHVTLLLFVPAVALFLPSMM